MNRGQDDRARVRMARAEIVEKFLAEIVGGIDVEDEEVGLLADDNVLRFLEAMRDIDVRGRRRFVQGSANGSREVAVRRENQDAAAWLGRNGMRRGLLVQNAKQSGRSRPVEPLPAWLLEMPASHEMKRLFDRANLRRDPLERNHGRKCRRAISPRAASTGREC